MKRLICRLLGHRWDVIGLLGWSVWCSRCASRREIGDFQ